MANKLSNEKINELWLAWQEKQSIRYVAQKCHVSKKTAERYRLKENWDERLVEIKQLAHEKADMKQAEQNAKYIKIAESTINLYAESLVKSITHTCRKYGKKTKITVPRTTITRNYFDKMVKLIRQELNIQDFEAKSEKKERSISLDELSLDVVKEIRRQLRQKYEKIEEQNQHSNKF